MNNIPNFFLVGVSKCGTTSLFNMLVAQDGCCFPSVKEPFYFNDPRKDYNWYISLFSGCRKSSVIGEATPIYSETTCFPDIPRKIYKFNSKAKILFSVRSPYDRLKSVWKQTLSSGHFFYNKYYTVRMPLRFEKAIFEYPPFLEACRYWTHIQNYRKYFDDSRIKVIYFEDYIKNTTEIMNEVNAFLGLGPFQEPALDSKQKNSSKGKTVFNPMVHFMSKIPGYKQITKAIPQNKKNDLKKKISISVPSNPHISERSKEKIRKVLNPELQLLFEYTGKPSDFWIL
jgi:hypothetical protein